MDEFDASAAPADGREATTGRGAPTGPAQPATSPAPVSRAPASSVALSRPDTAATGIPVTAPSLAASHDRGPHLAVTISRPDAPPQRLMALPPLPARLPSIPARLALTPPAPSPSLVPPQAPPREVPTAGIRPGSGLSREMSPRLWGWARRAALAGAMAFVAWFAVVIGSIAVFRHVDPPFSNLMLMQRLSGEVIVQKWTPIERMPAQVIRAIVVSEDGRFCEHGGIDLKAIETAIEASKDGTPRGASTITMQVAKNLYLWPSKSYVRKALEVPITLAIEAMWSKRRIFEVYANIAEWGPGVFGVEAAAGYHFGKSASRVSEREAALLAVALPNPISRDAGDPGPGTERLANTIQSRMRAQSRAAACIERPRRA